MSRQNLTSILAVCAVTAMMLCPNGTSQANSVPSADEIPCSFQGLPEIVNRGGDCGEPFNIRLVFFQYNDSAQDPDDVLLPAWSDLMEDDIYDYLDKLSLGTHVSSLETIKRAAPDDDKVWVTPDEADEYSFYGQVFDDLEDQFPSGWDDGVDIVLWFGVNGTATPWGGALLSPVCLGSRGEAFIRYATAIPSSGYFSPSTRASVTGAAVHEHGHVNGFGHHPDSRGHTAGSSACSGGWYACTGIMSNTGGAGCDDYVDVNGLLPYYPLHMIQQEWAYEDVVTSTTLGVELEDVRRNGRILRVDVQSGEYFLIANHQMTDYDSVYGTRGLLVWHVGGLASGCAWDGCNGQSCRVVDLEHAGGMFTPGFGNPYCSGPLSFPDPIDGVDAFDCSGGALVSATYTGLSVCPTCPVAEFTPTSNPSSDGYASGMADRHSDQTVDTGISIENIQSVVDPLDSSKYVLKFDVVLD